MKTARPAPPLPERACPVLVPRSSPAPSRRLSSSAPRVRGHARARSDRRGPEPARAPRAGLSDRVAHLHALKILTGWNWPIRIERRLGLSAFYASLHLSTYAGWKSVRWIFRRSSRHHRAPVILVGFIALLLLCTARVTSTAKMVKRLGFARWKRLTGCVRRGLARGGALLPAGEEGVTEPADLRGDPGLMLRSGWRAGLQGARREGQDPRGLVRSITVDG